MTEAVVTTPPERVAANLVTSENLAAFNADRLRLEIPVLGEKPMEAPKAEAAPVEEAPPAEEPKVEAKPEEKPSEKKPNGIQERFSDLAAKRRAAEERAAKAEADAAAAKKEADDLRAKAQPKVVQSADDPGPKPKLSDYGNDAEKWGDALIEWHKKDDSAKQAKAERERAQQERQRTFQERYALYKKENPEFEAKLDAQKDLIIAPAMEAEIVESDLGPAMLEHFATNPEEAIRIGRLEPRLQVKEMTRLEDKLRAAKKPAAEPAPKEEKPVAAPSKAPAPISALKPSAGSEVVDKIDNKGEFTGSFADYKALRKQGKIK